MPACRDLCWLLIQNNFSLHFREYVIVCSDTHCYMWQYSASGDVSATHGLMSSITKRDGYEFLFHVDDRTIRPFNELDNVQVSPNTSDAITAAVLNNEILIIGRESGSLLFFSLQHKILLSKQVLQLRPQHFALNCNASRLSVIDFNGILTMYHLKHESSSETDTSYTIEKIGVERKDVWNVQWSDDDELLCVIMEKVCEVEASGLRMKFLSSTSWSHFSIT